MNAEPRRWLHAGRISLWYYLENARNFPGWHLNADAAGCNSLAALLDELVDGVPATYLLDIVSPTPAQLRVPNNRSGQAVWMAPKRLCLSYTGGLNDWLFPLTNDDETSAEIATLHFGSAWIKPLREAIAGIPRGQGDYAIGSNAKGSNRLWFWCSIRA